MLPHRVYDLEGCSDLENEYLLDLHLLLDTISEENCKETTASTRTLSRIGLDGDLINERYISAN